MDHGVIIDLTAPMRQNAPECARAMRSKALHLALAQKDRVIRVEYLKSH
jgi:hypothetical protein